MKKIYNIDKGLNRLIDESVKIGYRSSYLLPQIPTGEVPYLIKRKSVK